MNRDFEIDEIIREYGGGTKQTASETSGGTVSREDFRSGNREEISGRVQKRKDSTDNPGKMIRTTQNPETSVKKSSGNLKKISSASKTNGIQNNQDRQIVREKQQYSDHMKERPRTGRKGKNGLGSALLTAILVTALILTAAGMAVTYIPFIFPNVTVNSKSLEWMTPEKAELVILESGWEEQMCRPLTVYTICDVSVEVDPVEAGTVMNAAGAARTAQQIGRRGNIFSNLYSFVRSFSEKVEISQLHGMLNDGYIDRQIALCSQKLNDAFGEEMYRIDEDTKELVLVKGFGSTILDTAGLKTAVISALEKRETELTYTTLIGNPVHPDFNALHTIVCTEPKNAAYSEEENHEILEEKPGYEFDIVTASELWDQAGLSDTVRIPLTVIEPEWTAEKLEALKFHDLLGAVTTKYNNSNENRSSNVRLAASKVNGIVLYPGEEFSFNDIVGKRTAEAGYLLAPAYAGIDNIKDEIGGGVCQVSTGVYAAALYAFMEITAHTCHMYPPNYIQLGTDTTVSIPEGGGRTIDFKFKNNKNCPIQIRAYCEEIEDRGDGKPLKTVTVEIWGTLEPDDYMPIEFDNSYWNIYDYDRVIDPPYPDREGVKLKLTHEENEFEDDNGKGLRTLTHRKVIDSDGNIIEDRIINRTYSEGYALDTYYYRG